MAGLHSCRTQYTPKVADVHYISRPILYSIGIYIYVCSRDTRKFGKSTIHSKHHFCHSCCCWWCCCWIASTHICVCVVYECASVRKCLSAHHGQQSNIELNSCRVFHCKSQINDKDNKKTNWMSARSLSITYYTYIRHAWSMYISVSLQLHSLSHDESMTIE